MFSACKGLRTDESPKIYFDLQEKLEEQILILLDEKASLTKTAILDGKEQTVEITPDSTRWHNELQLFLSATINKPNYKDLYTIEEKPDPNSNLTIRSYVHIDQKAMIPEMDVYYLKDIDNTVKISLKYKDQNVGFVADRHLTLQFEEINNEFLLKQYTISGFQKIIGMDTVKYEVIAFIKY